eukprot:6154221-Pleurochrysis_carterae.AAC.2
MHADERGRFYYLDIALFNRQDRTCREDMMCAENSELRGKMTALRTENVKLRLAAEGTKGEVRRREQVYDKQTVKRRRKHRADVSRNIKTAVATMAGEVNEAERVAQKERRQRAAIEKRLHKALTERNEICSPAWMLKASKPLVIETWCR